MAAGKSAKGVIARLRAIADCRRPCALRSGLMPASFEASTKMSKLDITRLQGRLENSFVHAAFSRFARCCFLQALFNQFRRHLLSACLYWMRLEYSTRRGLYSAITLPCAGAPMPNWHYNA